jgi:hypothetical protein
MIDVRRYNRSTILGAAKDLQQRCRMGEVSNFEYALELANYLLRDKDRIYWFYDPRSECWYHSDNSLWKTGECNSDSFEVPETVLFLSLDGKDDMADLKVAKTSLTDEASARQTLVAIVEEISLGFERGTLSSVDADIMLSRNVLFDLEGTIWAQGIRSKQWYIFKELQWQKSNSQPPEDDQLFQMEKKERRCLSCGELVDKGKFCSNCGNSDIEEEVSPPDAVVNALPNFMIFGLSSFPESITDAWEPPSDLPDEVTQTGFKCPVCQTEVSSGCLYFDEDKAEETVVICKECDAENQAGVKFCTNCGQKI